MKLHLLGLAVLIAACSGSDTTGTDTSQSINVAGKWRVAFIGNEAGQTVNFTGIMNITQNGANLTGTTDDDPHQTNTTLGSLTGTMSGTTMTVHAFGTGSTQDDCNKYPFDFTAEIATSGATGTLKGGTGTDCQGDGKGGHSKLTAVTITGGTLTKL